jgi:hypothetical protein
MWRMSRSSVHNLKARATHDNRKLRSTEKYIHHLNQIQHELAYYKSRVEMCIGLRDLSYPYLG